MGAPIPRQQNPLFYNLNGPEDVRRAALCAIDFLTEVRSVRKDQSAETYIGHMGSHLRLFRSFFEEMELEAMKSESITDLLAEVNEVLGNSLKAKGEENLEEDDWDGEYGD